MVRPCSFFFIFDAFADVDGTTAAAAGIALAAPPAVAAAR